VTGARVLAAVVALQLVAETALTPYWPALLRTLFGTQELAATGGFLAACRLAGLAALPLWALAARRWPVQRLLVGSLLACAVLDLALALAPNLLLFTVFSAGVVAAGSALVLAYPALVQVVGRTDDRLSPVLVGVAVFHAASLLATVVGAGVVALQEPRVGLAAFAVVDLLLAVLVWRRVPVAPVPARAPRRTARIARPARLVAPVAVVVGLAVLSDTGTSVPRPFFTELVLEGGQTLTTAALLFLLPSLGALLVLPAARLMAARLGDALLPLAALAGAAGLLVQAAAPTALPLVAAGRLALGAGLGLLAVALDLRLFAAVGTGGAGYALVETGRSVALLAAPLLATLAATTSLVLPLVVGAVLLGATALLAAASSAVQPASQEPAHVSYA
jgi:hypothetical protein